MGHLLQYIEVDRLKLYEGKKARTEKMQDLL